MIYKRLIAADARCDMAYFAGVRREAHIMVHCTHPGENFDSQLESVRKLADEVAGLTGMQAVFCRWFLSDATNQASQLPDMKCATTVVQKSPLDGTKVALWMILEEEAGFEEVAAGVFANDRGRIWMGDIPAQGHDSYALTESYLMRLNELLIARGGTMLDHCVRTWFFVRDVDVNYKGVVDGRNAVFSRTGLTRDTHFISSTGIEGRHPDPGVCVSFNAIADTSLRCGQMRHLHAATHLNPTIEYGVAFERGTTVDYADRREIYISGTASIDNRGEIVHPGDIRRQAARMLENIEVLLEEAEATFADVAHFIIYLRDAADYSVVDEIFSSRFPDTPRVIVLAPVCRPGWLIETECMAVKAISTSYGEY